MDYANLSGLVYDLVIVLAAGLLSGAICKRLGVSMLVGYLVVGGLLGGGTFVLVAYLLKVPELHDLWQRGRAWGMAQFRG